MTAPRSVGRIEAPAGAVRHEVAALDADTRVAIVAAEYHIDIVQPLVDGAVDECLERGVQAGSIVIVPVPGAFEVGPAALHCAEAGFDAVIVLACVIRGDTPHFDYVCSEAARGVAEASMATGIPVAFGVLTVETHAQAVSRTGGPDGHKGRESAAAALTMLQLIRAF